MRGVFFYTLILSFASGIFIRSFFISSLPIELWFLLVGGALLFVWWSKPSLEYSAPVLVLSLCAVGISLGMLRMALVDYQTPPPRLASSLGVVTTNTGMVVREPEQGAKNLALTVEFGKEKVLVKVDRSSPVLYGDMVKVTGKLALPEAFTTDTGRTFDYPGYLRAKGITYTMSFAQVVVTDTSTGNPLLRSLFAGKTRFLNSLEAVISQPEAGLAAGLLLGVKESLGDELETSFRRAGITHIIVLSGFNIMVIVWFVLLVLSRFFTVRVQAVIGIGAIIVFAILVGLGASVVRASVMAALGLLALLVGRRYAVMRALFVAGTIMLVINPLLLVHDVGFQLSFLATLGLLLVSPQLEPFFTWVPKTWGLREFFLATLSTQLTVMPILLYEMGQFSIISLVVNVLVLPAVPTAMFLTFVTGLIALVSPLFAAPAAFLSYLILTYIITVATKFAALKMAVISVPLFSAWLIPLWYLLLGSWIYWRLSVQTEATQPIELPNDALAALEGWTIVEQNDPKSQTKTGNTAVVSPVPVIDDTPIFFR